MKLKLQIRKCPTCLGTGKIRQRHPFRQYTNATRQKARRLLREGYSLRQIAVKLGIKPPHPNKVVSLINAKTR